jgi:hypothetical protein
MIRLIKELVRAIFENPREGIVIVKVLIGLIVTVILSVIYILPQEYIKKLLDKIMPYMIKFRHEKNRNHRYEKT